MLRGKNITKVFSLEFQTGLYVSSKFVKQGLAYQHYIQNSGFHSGTGHERAKSVRRKGFPKGL